MATESIQCYEINMELVLLVSLLSDFFHEDYLMATLVAENLTFAYTKKS